MKMPKSVDRIRHILTIPPHSTCCTLGFPQKFGCSVCLPRLDPLARKRKKKKEERCKNQWQKCKQLWDVATLRNSKLTTGEVKLSRLQCRFLNINVTDLNKHCDVQKMLDLDDSSAQETNIFSHGISHSIYTSDELPPLPVADRVEAQQMCSESVLPGDNSRVSMTPTPTEFSYPPKPSTKQEVHSEFLYSRVSKKKLGELERHGNLWNKILKGINRKKYVSTEMGRKIYCDGTSACTKVGTRSSLHNDVPVY